MGSESKLVHVFLVSFPGQGHVNPLLRLGKRLASKGLLVTFTTPESIGKQMRKASNITDQPTPVGDGMIRFEFFEDGAMLWVQSCACLSTYYHYYHGLVPFPSEAEPEIDVQLPCMPLLKYDEIASFLYPTTPYPFLRRAILGQYKNLDKPFCILMDTFQELEPEVIEYMSKICPIKPVGPLYKNPKVPNAAVRGDFMKAVAEGGSSDRNLQEFVDEVRRMSLELVCKSKKI
ncbi:unnamed protein product, partial [Vitis vinifera]